MYKEELLFPLVCDMFFPRGFQIP